MRNYNFDCIFQQSNTEIQLIIEISKSAIERNLVYFRLCVCVYSFHSSDHRNRIILNLIMTRISDNNK